MNKAESELPVSEMEKGLLSAQFVQQGLLPKKRHFERLFNDYFALYLPQNIVSGDFYWVGQHHDLKYIVVGDCTGHGISASLLSVLALNLFEYTVMNKEIKKTNRILQEVDKRFIACFKDAHKVNFDNPWIDLSLVCIDEKQQKLYYSAANRKMLHVKKGEELLIYKGSNYPIGGWQIEESRNFEAQSISYKKGDVIYLGSDGFQDQFGGPDNKKYSSKRLHKILAKNADLPMKDLKKKLHNEFLDWKGTAIQVDDVCILGIRL
ncbi:MAG: SpoIIE family protein phosphatase [Crocinitomicaceae bacterium]